MQEITLKQKRVLEENQEKFREITIIANKTEKKNKKPKVHKVFQKIKEKFREILPLKIKFTRFRVITLLAKKRINFEKEIKL